MGKKKRILVVDDYLQVVEMLRIRLETAGYEVLTACDGHEALQKARTEKPDLIILDVMLPKMNGYKVCRFLKFDKRYKDIPIIMLTSRAKQSDVEIGLQTGADEYICKPYDPVKLLKTIKKYI
ncbi:two-component system response regulator [candidate division KSB1 bacterium]|nr:MAG: two-component system response regulator [candidate division KSB1 bacterium]